jgi:ParB family chromosome partitioning protein
MIIKFDKLVPNDYNPRKLFRSASLEELKKSIKNYGLIEPLVVRPINENKYEVICGMRRYYALKDLGIKEVECTVKKINDTDAIDLAFMENIQRENLTPIEEAKMYLTRLKMFPDYEEFNDSNSFIQYNPKLTKKISNLYSISEGTIRNRLSLLNLPEELENAVENNELSLTVAYEIARLCRIEDKKITTESMLEMYNDYKLEKDTITLAEINARVSGKIDYHKSKEREQKGITQQRIKDLEKKIQETINSKNEVIRKLERKINEVYNNDAFKKIDFSHVEENVEIINKSGLMLELLEKENEKYASDEIYEKLVTNINNIENGLSDIRLLISRTKEKNIRVCPFCFARIDLPAIKRKEENYKEELEELKKQRKLIAGIKGFISDTIKQIKKFLKTLDAKDGFIEQFNKNLEVLRENV